MNNPNELLVPSLFACLKVQPHVSQKYREITIVWCYRRRKLKKRMSRQHFCMPQFTILEWNTCKLLANPIFWLPTQWFQLPICSLLSLSAYHYTLCPAKRKLLNEREAKYWHYVIHWLECNRVAKNGTVKVGLKTKVTELLWLKNLIRTWWLVTAGVLGFYPSLTVLRYERCGWSEVLAEEETAFNMAVYECGLGGFCCRFSE